MTDADLLRRYHNLESAMRTCDDGDEWIRCASRLDELGAEIQRRGLTMPEPPARHEYT